MMCLFLSLLAFVLVFLEELPSNYDGNYVVIFLLEIYSMKGDKIVY